MGRRRTPIDPVAVARKHKAAELSLWDTLTALIAQYRDAAIDESWKGGGDPADVEIMEARLILAQAELSGHIQQMRRELE